MERKHSVPSFVKVNNKDGILVVAVMRNKTRASGWFTIAPAATSERSVTGLKIKDPRKVVVAKTADMRRFETLFNGDEVSGVSLSQLALTDDWELREKDFLVWYGIEVVDE